MDHLRLSLTDHCNLACRYCIPDGVTPNGQMMDADFAFAIAKWLVESHGIGHLRLTGGEPLLHPDLIGLISRLAELETLHEITLTTNAQALARIAYRLRDTGLARINISLDTLDPQRFAHITRGGDIRHTLEGVEAAVAAGLTPVKINVVAQRGFNDDDLPDIAEWGLRRGCVVRFLEVMPIGPLAHVAEEHLVPAAEILQRLSERFELRAISQSLGQPSVDYAAHGRDVRGLIGVIAPTTRPFCSRCRRLRMTSQGYLVACVHDGTRFDLRPFWDGEELDVKGADATLLRAASGKPAVGPAAQTLTMLSLGG